MTEKEIRGVLRRRLGVPGLTVLVYYAIMYGIVTITTMVEGFFSVAGCGGIVDAETVAASASGSGWGYLFAIASGLMIVLAWKGSGYATREIWEKKAPMTGSAFIQILPIFVGMQLVFSLAAQLLNWLLAPLGVDIMAAMEAASGQADTLSMFLYGCFVAPVAEEVLFRGLIQGTVRPYGKKISIFISALLFGLFHGNPVQTPFAFVLGLILGYVAEEYGLMWCVVLHGFNNLVLADLLPRILGFLPGDFGNGIIGMFIICCAIAGVVILIVQRRNVSAYLRSDRMDGRCLRCFFTSPATIIFTVLMLLNMVMWIFLGKIAA